MNRVSKLTPVLLYAIVGWGLSRFVSESVAQFTVLATLGLIAGWMSNWSP